MTYALRMLSLAATAAMAVAVSRSADARTVTFGSGANEFTIEFVTIGNPGNPADTTGNPNPAGAVSYVYDIGKYEVSRGMVEKANAAGGLGITMSTMVTTPGYSDPDRPATGISWNEATRFVNWLNTSQGHTPAYKHAIQPRDPDYVISNSVNATPNANILLWEPGDPGYNAANPFRNSNARYFLPSMDEWYKAAYYDPNHGGPGVGGYWNYPTGSDDAPTAVANGTLPNTVVSGNASSVGPADIFNAGGLSPYGTMAQAGNVLEWMETEIDLVNDTVDGRRANRGGHWYNTVGVNGPVYQAHFQIGNNPPNTGPMAYGFRVAAAAIPEPSTFALGGLGLIGLIQSVRRLRRD